MFDRVEFLLRAQAAFRAGDPVPAKDAARFIRAIDAVLCDSGAKLDKLLGLNKQRVSIAEEYKLRKRARLIEQFYWAHLSEIGPYAASFEIADNLELLCKDYTTLGVADEFRRLFDDLVTNDCRIPSQKTAREFLPKGTF